MSSWLQVGARQRAGLVRLRREPPQLLLEHARDLVAADAREGQRPCRAQGRVRRGEEGEHLLAGGALLLAATDRVGGACAGESELGAASRIVRLSEERLAELLALLGRHPFEERVRQEARGRRRELLLAREERGERAREDVGVGFLALEAARRREQLGLLGELTAEPLVEDAVQLRLAEEARQVPQARRASPELGRRHVGRRGQLLVNEHGEVGDLGPVLGHGRGGGRRGDRREGEREGEDGVQDHGGLVRGAGVEPGGVGAGPIARRRPAGGAQMAPCSRIGTLYALAGLASGGEIAPGGACSPPSPRKRISNRRRSRRRP